MSQCDEHIFQMGRNHQLEKDNYLVLSCFLFKNMFLSITITILLITKQKNPIQKKHKKKSRWLSFFLHFVDPTGESLNFAQSFHLGSVFKLHDFGFRGVSSVESAAIGGATWQHSFWESE